MRLLLHACCGPCLLEPYDSLAREHDVSVAFANPNIHPNAEYRRRRDTLMAYAESQGISVMELPYRPDAWERAVAPSAGDRARRCSACFRLRLGMVARAAADAGFDAVATTLTVSPHQDQAAVHAAGLAACADTGVLFLETDFRHLYPRSVRRSRDLGMYRQSFCGCRRSRSEADADRAERRQRQEAERASRKSAHEPDASAPGSA